MSTASALKNQHKFLYFFVAFSDVKSYLITTEEDNLIRIENGRNNYNSTYMVSG